MKRGRWKCALPMSNIEVFFKSRSFAQLLWIETNINCCSSSAVRIATLGKITFIFTYLYGKIKTCMHDMPVSSESCQKTQICLRAESNLANQIRKMLPNFVWNSQDRILQSEELKINFLRRCSRMDWRTVTICNYSSFCNISMSG